MSKIVSASVSEYTWNETVAKNPYKNRSEWVEELLIRGKKCYDAEMAQKQEHLKATAENQDLEKGPLLSLAGVAPDFFESLKGTIAGGVKC